MKALTLKTLLACAGFFLVALRREFDYIQIKYLIILRVWKPSCNQAFFFAVCVPAVECLFRGVAYFDSIRHLYVGDEQTDNAGYLYYPDLDKMVAALRMLRKLERKFCQLSG